MYKLLLMIHFLSLAGTLGISITVFVLGIHAKTLPAGEAAPLMGRVAVAVRHVSIVGLTLLVLSGIAMLLVGDLRILGPAGWWFPAKLFFVAAAVTAFIIAQVYQARARRRAEPQAAAGRAAWAGGFALSAAVLATISAVMAFE